MRLGFHVRADVVATILGQLREHVVLHAVWQPSDQARKVVRLHGGDVGVRGVRDHAAVRHRHVIELEQVLSMSTRDRVQAEAPEHRSQADLQCHGLEPTVNRQQRDVANAHDTAVVRVDNLTIEHAIAERGQARRRDGRTQRKRAVVPVRLAGLGVGDDRTHRPRGACGLDQQVADLLAMRQPAAKQVAELDRSGSAIGHAPRLSASRNPEAVGSRGMESFIVDAVRTPFGKNRLGLSAIRVDDLAALPIRELIARHPELDPAHVDEVLMGDTNQAGEDNRNVARMALLLAGLPVSVPGVTVNRLCGSGGEAVIQGSRMLRCGDADVVIAGGVEGMSRSPFILQKPDDALPRDMKLHSTAVGWRMINTAMPEEWLLSLGAAAEQTGVRLGITREQMDAWSVRSHARAHAAWEAGLHDDVVMEVEGVTRDESIRPGTTMESLAGLKPAFTKDGVVTAGNSSPINDGALAMLVASKQACTARGWEPLARIGHSLHVGVAPQEFGYAPVPAIRALLAKAGLTAADIDVWELQEAFAAVPLTVLHEIDGIDEEKVNVHGGAIAYGHPLGASAPRLILDCVRELQRRGGGTGLVAACIGVGQGQALLVHVG